LISVKDGRVTLSQIADPALADRLSAALSPSVAASVRLALQPMGAEVFLGLGDHDEVSAYSSATLGWRPQSPDRVFFPRASGAGFAARRSVAGKKMSRTESSFR
jgi:hypothetical protein